PARRRGGGLLGQGARGDRAGLLGNSHDHGEPAVRHLHLLLHGPGTSRGRHARDSHGEVVPTPRDSRGWRRRRGPRTRLLSVRGRFLRRQDPRARRGYSGRARPTESATQTGLSEPSTSTVKRVTICHQPPPTSSTSTISAVVRTLEPAGTGAGKRTLFQP